MLMSKKSQLDKTVERFWETRRALDEARGMVNQIEGKEFIERGVDYAKEREDEITEEIMDTYNEPRSNQIRWAIRGAKNGFKNGNVDSDECIDDGARALDNNGRLIEMFENTIDYRESIRNINNTLQEKEGDWSEDYINSLEGEVDDMIDMVGNDLKYLENLKKQVRNDPVYFFENQIEDLFEKESDLSETVEEKTGKISNEKGEIRSELKKYIDVVEEYAQEAENEIDENVMSDEYFNILMEICHLKKKYETDGLLKDYEESEPGDPTEISRIAYNVEDWKGKTIEELEEGAMSPEEAFEKVFDIYEHTVNEGNIEGFRESVERVQEKLGEDEIEDPLEPMSDVYEELVEEEGLNKEEYRKSRAFVKMKDDVKEVFGKAYEEGGSEALKNYIDMN